MQSYSITLLLLSGSGLLSLGFSFRLLSYSYFILWWCAFLHLLCADQNLVLSGKTIVKIVTKSFLIPLFRHTSYLSHVSHTSKNTIPIA